MNLMMCLKCTKIIFPFGQLENVYEFEYEFDLPSFLDSIPFFKITFDLINLRNLADYDIDEHLPSNVNSSYHTLQDLLTLNTSEKDFSLFHMNVRSHSLHYDEIFSTLSSLKNNFDVFGVSETWNSFENPIKTNVEVPCYSYFPQQSHSQNGGVALYIKTNLTSIVRPDLERDSHDFESVWVEIENKNGKNFIVCCVYRHPSSSIDTFSDYFPGCIPCS